MAEQIEQKPPKRKGNPKWQKGMGKVAGSGRTPGTPNKFTTIKQAFVDAMEELGGKDFIKEVAKTSRGKQCVLNNMAKLLPNKTEITGEDGGPIKLNVAVNVNLVRPKGNK